MRKIRRLTIILGAAIGVVVALVTPAAAYDETNSVSCHYSTPFLKWKNSTTRVGYSTPARAAAQAWTATPTPIYWTEVSSGANLTITDGVFSDPGLVALTQYGAQTSCGGGHYRYAPVAWFNRTFLDSWGGAARQSAMVHEVGHALGLGHSQYSNCSAIMYWSFNVTYMSCGLTTPRSDDIAGINYIY